MSKEEFIDLILQTSRSELIELLHEISTADFNGLDNAIQKIEELINLKE